MDDITPGIVSGSSVTILGSAATTQLVNVQILPEPHIGDPFPGHDRINHSLADIQRIVTQNRPDWRIALEHMKGVYVIHDRLTGEPYVGSAYGDTGIWQRWTHYAESIHGDN